MYFDLDKYNNDGRFGFGEGDKIKVTFNIDKIAGAHLLETPLSKDQSVIENDNDYEISATVIDSLQFEWWIRKFGDDIFNVRKESV